MKHSKQKCRVGGGVKEEPRFKVFRQCKKNRGRGQCDPGIEVILKIQKKVGVDVNQELKLI